MKVISNSSVASQFFGKAALAYDHTFIHIGNRIFMEEYQFLDNDIFKKIMLESANGVKQSGQIYWSEMLMRAHMVSIGAIARTSRWVDAAVREYEAGNLYGWASACRSLMESAGDITHSLGSVPLTLGEHHKAILDNLSANYNEGVLTSQELENILIHFTHARKLQKGEEVPDSFKAEPPWKYIKHLEDMGHSGSKQLYAELCQIVHPAESSVRTLFETRDGTFKLGISSESSALRELAKNSSEVLGGALQTAFNPPILTLKVLQKFGIFKQVKGLRTTGLESIPLWKKVDSFL